MDAPGPIGEEGVALSQVAKFERFITSSPYVRGQYHGFPPEEWTTGDMGDEERTARLAWLEEQLPEKDFEMFKVYLLRPLVLALSHSTYANKLSDINVILQQTLWDLGFDKVENFSQYDKLINEETSEIMRKIYEEYLLEVNYKPYSHEELWI